MASDKKEKDLRADAKNFCESLGNVFMMKKRDPQTQHLLEKAKSLIESLITTSERRLKSDRPVVPPKPSRGGGGGGGGVGGGGGGMGQLWVKLDELKRENEQLRRRQTSKAADEKTSVGKGHGPGEVIIADLHKTKAENDSLKAQLDKAQTTIAELEKINYGLQDEFKRTKIAHEVAQSSLEKVKREHQTLESSLNSVKSENDTLKMRLTHSVKPMKRPDPRLVENIGERCRPSTVAVLYDSLEAHQWVDAKEALEDAGLEPEETITRFLCHVLMMCYEASGELLDGVGVGISEILLEPSKVLGNTKSSAKHGNVLTDEMSHGVKEILRQHADKIDVDLLAERCIDKVRQDGSWTECEDALSLESVRHYIQQCARVTWQMHVQQSPMCLYTGDGQFDADRHRLWWSCSQAGASTIQFYIWPSLYDAREGNMMVKGCVYAS